jgi:hypothetical protein
MERRQFMSHTLATAAVEDVVSSVMPMHRCNAGHRHFDGGNVIT